MRGWVILAAFAAALAFPGHAQRIPVVGILVIAKVSPEEFARGDVPLQRAFVEGMRSRGWEPGRNVRYEWRSAQLSEEQGRREIDGLVAAGIDVVVAPGPFASRALERSPVLPVVGLDFDAALVPSLARPGGRITGIVRARSDAEVVEARTKVLALARDITGATRIARLLPAEAGQIHPPVSPVTVARARDIGVTLDTVGFLEGKDMDRAVAEARRRGVGALVVTNFAQWNEANSRAFAEAARRHRMPVVGEPIHNAKLDDVMVASYGVDLRQVFARSAYFVDRILRGSRPGDLPVEDVTEPRLVVYPRNARALGLGIPDAVLVRADEVVP